MALGKAEGRSAVLRDVLRHFLDGERQPFPDLSWSGKGSLSLGFAWIQEIVVIAYLYRCWKYIGQGYLARRVFLWMKGKISQRFLCSRKPSVKGIVYQRSHVGE